MFTQRFPAASLLGSTACGMGLGSHSRSVPERKGRRAMWKHKCRLASNKKPRRKHPPGCWNRNMPSVINVAALITFGKTMIEVVNQLLIIWDHVPFS